mgnify:CR=1 FL=1
MAIGGIDSSYLNTITDASSAQSKADQVKFEEILKRTMSTDADDDEQLLEACEEFESYYLNKVFDEMRSSIPKSSLVEKSQGNEIYEDMLYDAYTKEMAKGSGTGIKEMLYRQLKK